HRVLLELGLVDELDVVPVRIKPVLLEVEPVVEAGMRAAGADLPPIEIGEPVDARIGAHHELMVDLVDRLPEIDPAVAAGAMTIGRDVIADYELDIARGHRAVRFARGDVTVVVDLEAMLFPGAGFGDHVQQNEMAAGSIGN